MNCHKQVHLRIRHGCHNILFRDLSRDLDLGIVSDPVDRNGRLALVQPRGRLWRFGQQEIGRDSEGHGGEAFEDKDPLPAVNVEPAVEVADRARDQAAKGASTGAEHAEEGHAEGLFGFLVEHGDIDQDTWNQCRWREEAMIMLF